MTRVCMPTSTFSIAVMFENRRIFWNVRQTPAAVISSGRSPTSERPLNVTEPESGA